MVMDMVKEDIVDITLMKEEVVGIQPLLQLYHQFNQQQL